jgi:hypothetical protein
VGLGGVSLFRVLTARLSPPLACALDTANTDAAGTDASRATAVGSVGPQDALTTKALCALVHRVQAQFPDTWEDVLRSWEWRKTSF